MIRTTGYDFFCELMFYRNCTERELWFLFFFRFAVLVAAFILVLLMKYFGKMMEERK